MESKSYGVDVSKETLDIACDGRVVTIENEPKAIRRFVKSTGEGSLVAMESTNTYHEKMANACFAAGLRVYVVNPRVTRHYREVMSLHGHNDKMDARAISSYIQRHYDELRPYAPKPKDALRLATLNRRRSKLVGIRVQLWQSMREVKELKSDIEAIIARIDELVAKVQLLIEKQLEGDEDRARLETIKGIGPVVSAALVCDLKYGDFRKADAFVAYYGLDPRPNDSGKSKGRRKISKRGQRLGRTLLYNAAMTAARSKAWKPIYERLLAKGLAKIQALAALARKIARTAWSVYTHKTTFDPARLCRALT